MKLLKYLIIMLTVFLFAGSVLALPTPLPTPPTGYDINGNIDFWKVTDSTTNVEGTAFFELKVEFAAYESGFGLYTVNDIYDPTTVISTFEIFAPGDEPNPIYGNNKTITFFNDEGDWKITDQYDSDDPESSPWESFGSTFGYYFDVDAGNNNYTFYTANSLNTQDKDIEHILTAYNPDTKCSYIYLEDLLASNADWDWEDMVVFANDVQPAPVPEPASMMLFGTGLIGLAAFTRRKLNFKK